MRHSLLISTIAAVAMASAVQAATVTVNLDHGALIKTDGTVFIPENYPGTGNFGGPTGFNGNGGFSFKLPAITAGEQVTSMLFRAGSADGNGGFDVLQNLPSEVFALRITATNVFVGADYGSGVSQPGTPVSTGFFTGTTGLLPDIDVMSWVNGVGGGYVADNFLLLRMGTSASNATITANGARWWTQASDAKLIITTTVVPEPTMLGLLGLSALSLVRRRHA